ncbi:MAG TPA: CvpA family protein [Myxococcota bacterium]|nr:CvpA family protein [Myxococcota bacterium]
MLFDGIAIALAFIFVALGALRGTLAGFLRVVTLACAYLAGYLAGSKVAPVVALVAGTSKLVAALALATFAFAVVYAIGAIISALVIRYERDHRADRPRSAYDRFGGACFGALQAGLALLLLAVLGSVLDAAYRMGLPQGMDQSGSFLVGSTRRVVASGLGAAMGDGPASKFVVKLVGDPGRALQSAQQLLAGPRFAALQGDALFWELLAHGNVDDALARTSFFQLMHDDATRATLADLGVVPEAARRDPQAFRAAMRTSLTAAAPRIRAIRDDPAIARLAADPEVQIALAQGDSVALLSHPEMRALVDRVLRAYENGGGASP